MSRRQLPSRLSIFLAACAAVFALTAQASAEQVRTDQIGGSRALLACSDAARQGDVSDRALLACDAALQTPLILAQRVAVLVNRGSLRVRRGEHAIALTDFDAALALEPNNAAAMFNRGMVLVHLNQSGPAVAALTNALSLGVQTPYLAYYFRGVARERLGNLRGALEDYSTALEIQPNWGPAEQEIARFAQVRREALTAQLGAAAPPQ